MIALAAALGLLVQTNSVLLSPPAVDATTLHKKVLCGYQGWFRAGGDSGTRSGPLESRLEQSTLN